MNRIIFMGRLTKDPETRYAGADNSTCIANFDIAVDKRFKKKDDQNGATADFFRITALGKLGEFVNNYLKKGTKVVVEGRVENNNYTNKDGQKVYGFQFIAESIEFAESKKAQDANASTPSVESFNNVNESIDTSALPFK